MELIYLVGNGHPKTGAPLSIQTDGSTLQPNDDYHIVSLTAMLLEGPSCYMGLGRVSFKLKGVRANTQITCMAGSLTRGVHIHGNSGIKFVGVGVRMHGATVYVQQDRAGALGFVQQGAYPPDNQNEWSFVTGLYLKEESFSSALQIA
ncbi:hypothetical protein VNO77_03448 [Canavalia gladiata]|uniref:Uncharacterized protein n=1 Tax=Canavalia gladiata TaxID=3824 RepID=A0AAN9MWR4_CANGL